MDGLSDSETLILKFQSRLWGHVRCHTLISDGNPGKQQGSDMEPQSFQYSTTDTQQLHHKNRDRARCPCGHTIGHLRGKIHLVAPSFNKEEESFEGKIRVKAKIYLYQYNH